MVDAMLEWFRLRYCMLARDSVATKHNIMLTEKPPETTPETAKPADITTSAAIRVPDCAGEILTSEVTHLLEL